MQRKRFTEEQIIRVLHEAEILGNIRAFYRQHNMPSRPCIGGGGLEIAEAKCLRALERENAELKRLVSDLTCDNRMLQDVLGKSAKPVSQAHYRSLSGAKLCSERAARLPGTVIASQYQAAAAQPPRTRGR
jgi:putative transposase